MEIGRHLGISVFSVCHLPVRWYICSSHYQRVSWILQSVSPTEPCIVVHSCAHLPSSQTISAMRVHISIYSLPHCLIDHPTISLVVMISTLGILQNDALVKTPIGLCRNPDYARKDCSVFVIYQSDGMFFSLSKNLLNFAVSFSHWTLHCCALLCTPSFLPNHLCNESPYIYLLPSALPHRSPHH